MNKALTNLAQCLADKERNVMPKSSRSICNYYDDVQLDEFSQDAAFCFFFFLSLSSLKANKDFPSPAGLKPELTQFISKGFAISPPPKFPLSL